MNETDKPRTWGGARPGAGRPRTDSEYFTFKVGGAVAKRIKENDNKSRFIIDCIQERMEHEKMLLPDMSDIGTVVSLNNSPVLISFYDNPVACGLPIGQGADTMMEVRDMLHMICPNTDTSFAIVAQGNSMIDADIHSGDVIFVDSSHRTPERNVPMLCQLNGGHTVKYVRKYDYGYTLIPANETFAERTVDENDEFAIIGTVVSVVHRF